MRTILRFLAAAFGVALLATVASACPVCFSATDENRMAFLGTTALLTFLPLGMLAGGVLYLRRRAREIDEEETDSDF